MKRCVLLALLLSVSAFGQVTRSTLTGQITDPSGAIIPNAKIAITNTDTGTKTNVTSNSAGDYTVPFLQPGPYSITVVSPGFKAFIHEGITLETEQTVTENIKLSLGQVSETVTINGDAPLVDTATASTGQTLTAEEVEDLPSNGRSPLGFAHLEYGAVAKGKHSESQTTPFGNSTADDFSLGGGNSASNELLLNGVPNMEDGGRTAGFSPNLDAVEAVHVDEFSSDAALGDTSGGIVNITTKHGTNQFHGTAEEYYAGSRPLTAKPYFTQAGTSAPSTHFNQFGATIGGPIIAPYLFNGRNKLFFFYAFEGYIGNAPATTITSVPTAAERTGDFSALLNFNSADQLYNPYSGVSTTTGSTTTISRTKIPGNILSNAGLTINPIATAYMTLIPLPNYNGASTKADGENNFFASDPTTNNYKSHHGTIDYNISNSNKIFADGHRSKYVNGQSNIFNNVLSGTTSTVILSGGQLDDVQNFNPTLNLEARLGFSRYTSYSNPSSAGSNPTSLGFPGYIAANSTTLALPAFTFSDSAAIPSLSAAPGNIERFTDVQLYASLNKTWGKHTLKIGPDIRANKNSSLGPGAADGTFSFKPASGGFVTSGTNGATQQFGGAFALFDLGLPQSGSYAVNTKFQYDNWYIGTFIQDDWKLLPNLTISMGMRVEHETAPVESNNQMVQTFLPNATNQTTAAAIAAYSKAPNANVPVASFQPTGGILYDGSDNRHPYGTAAAYVSPRIGFAYSPPFSHGTLAIRGGVGVYVNPFGDYNVGQSYGYSQTTTFIPTINNSITPSSTISDPFPTATNPIVLPYGNAQGINTNLGAGIVYIDPNVKVPYANKWSLDISKQLQKNWLVEVGYIGTHAVHNNYSNAISSTPLLPYLSTCPYGAAAANACGAQTKAVQTTLSTSVTNPFKGTMTGAAATTSYNTAATLSVSQLLQEYPEYTSVTEQVVPGQSSNFNALLIRVSKRMSYGLSFNFNYEYSRQLGTTVQLNAGGPLSYEETSSDFPNHPSLTVIYQLPFGRGRQFANHSKLLDEIIGGYSVTSIYQYLSGTPLSFGNAIFNGSYSNFQNHPHQTIGPSFNTSGFDTVTADQPGSYNYRTFPQYLLRSDPTNNFDFSILKNFTLYDRLILQPRVDAFNALNRPQFSSANVSPTSAAFSDVTGQLNTNRSLQGGLHLIF